MTRDHSPTGGGGGRPSEAAHQGFAAERVPPAAQGGGLRVFLIVAGSLCGLPAFILSTSVFGALGFERGLAAVLLGTAISAALGACTAAAGSRARAGLAVLADAAFGRGGAALVKLVIALSLIGWFGVNIGVLGVTATGALSRMTGASIPPLAFGLPACLAIAVVTAIGARGLERLGSVLVPLTLGVLLASVALASDRLGTLRGIPGSNALGFGQAVSAIVGSYVVGIVIQPDYGRFVRRPVAAAAGAGAALGIVYPIVLCMSAAASLALGAPDLVTAMILLGMGPLALLVLVLGSWIDASACLYSASLSLVSQFPRMRFVPVVATVALVGVGLVLAGAYAMFIPFLLTLGIGLPPLAVVLASSARRAPDERTVGSGVPPSWALPTSAWAAGTAVGACAAGGIVTLTHVPTLDSVAATIAVLAIARGRTGRKRTGGRGGDRPAGASPA